MICFLWNADRPTDSIRVKIIKIIRKDVATRAGDKRCKPMKQISITSLNALIKNHPANGLKVLDTPYVLVVKTNTGTTVVYQNRHFQSNTSVGNHVFGGEIGVETVFDFELTSNRHALAFVVSEHDANGNVIEKKIFSIGEKGAQNEYVTAFLAYEAEGGKAVYCINIIEESGSKPIFTASVRFCKSSEKLLKAQLRMYLALSGLNGEEREKIVNGGGILPPTCISGKDGDHDEQ